MGLLGRAERTTGWHLTEAIGDKGSQGAPGLLTSMKRDADPVRDALREHAVECGACTRAKGA